MSKLIFPTMMPQCTPLTTFCILSTTGIAATSRPFYSLPSCDGRKSGPHELAPNSASRRRLFPDFFRCIPVFFPPFFLLYVQLHPLPAGCFSLFSVSWVIMGTRRQARLRQERRRAQAVERDSRREHSRQRDNDAQRSPHWQGRGRTTSSNILLSTLDKGQPVVLKPWGREHLATRAHPSTPCRRYEMSISIVQIQSRKHVVVCRC